MYYREELRFEPYLGHRFLSVEEQTQSHQHVALDMPPPPSHLTTFMNIAGPRSPNGEFGENHVAAVRQRPLEGVQIS